MSRLRRGLLGLLALGILFLGTLGLGLFVYRHGGSIDYAIKTVAVLAGLGLFLMLYFLGLSRVVKAAAAAAIVAGVVLAPPLAHAGEQVVVYVEFTVPQWNSIARVDFCRGVYFEHDHPWYGVPDGVYVHGSYHPLKAERLRGSLYNATIVFDLEDGVLYYGGDRACPLADFHPHASGPDPDRVLVIRVYNSTQEDGPASGSSPVLMLALAGGAVALAGFLALRGGSR